MGLFPGAKKYFREHSGAFFSGGDVACAPDIYITDLMLTLYMYDVARVDGTVGELALFLWRRVLHPNGVASIAKGQIHVVTFDVHEHSPPAKSLMQKRRTERLAPGAQGEAAPAAPPLEMMAAEGERLPSPLAASLRDRGFIRALIERLVERFKGLYATAPSAQGDVVVQCHLGALRMRRVRFGEAVFEPIVTDREPERISEVRRAGRASPAPARAPRQRRSSETTGASRARRAI